MVGTCAGFIAQTPGVDTGVVFIPLKHARRPVGKDGSPLGVAAEVIVKSVMFKIGLVNDIKTEFIAQIIKFRSRRIMAGTDCVDIETLHGDDVKAKRFIRHGLAELRMMFVAVDAADKNTFAVDEEVPVFHLIPPESDSDRGRITDFAFLVRQFDAEGVKKRGLSVPALDFGELRPSLTSDPGDGGCVKVRCCCRTCRKRCRGRCPPATRGNRRERKDRR